MFKRQNLDTFPLQSLPGHGTLEEIGPSTGSRHNEHPRESDVFLPSPDISRASSVPPSIKGDPKVTEQRTPSTRLHRSAFVLFLVFFYAALALFSWTITCILTVRPITGPHHYGIFMDNLYGYGYINDVPLYTYYAKSENWLKAARVIQSIVGILTIPLTSAVCSSAAVVFVQQNAKSNLSLRQLMTFSDKTWADPATYPRAIMSWKHYGSSLLFVAIILNTLGFIITPLQEILLGSNTIKTPTVPQIVQRFLDIPDQFNQDAGHYDDNLIVTLTRNALMTASQVQPQAQLWRGASNATCNTLELLQIQPNTPLSDSCGRENTLGNIAKMKDTFLAEPSSGYSTGLIRQFIPRFNSTATYENVTGTGSFPVGCDQKLGSFYAKYADKIMDTKVVYGSWSIEACMPANLTKSPWKNTRDRQDFSEELYLNITLLGNYMWNTAASGWQFRVSVSTTAGYFELPNYMNGAMPGPLLLKDPNSICGNDCYAEGGNLIYNHNVTAKNTRRADDASDNFDANIANSSLSLERVSNKGPLLTISMALFGSGSFLANRIAHPEAYWGVNDTNSIPSSVPDPPNEGSCIDLAPMGRLLSSLQDGVTKGSYADYCIANTAGGVGGRNLGEYMMTWVRSFAIDDTDGLTTAFTAASFLANQAWMMNNVNSDFRTLSIHFDYGADTQVPTISTAGMILISVLLGIDLIALFAMGIYASFSIRWTNQLDSFAMIRLGTSMADKLPLMVGLQKDKMKMLDELPGSVGDAADEHEMVGRLGLGAQNALSKRRRYECFEEDKETID
ncbi:uncharacterized protein PAC_15207 [Phialocephala subalpina]|uniref:Uncharacterized protein n=1 Tax=Phialocephala subalpina TaxID=576137 RepID=A0A1L7XK32_9HELO|nr:uncharacterized protein PAC_15207 [Phialocephala subalpina]